MHRSNITAITALVAVVALAISTPASAQLVNGSFELPVSSGLNQIISGGDSTSITGWTTTRNGVERFDPALYSVGPAPSGSIIVDICPFTFTGGGIQQTFATTVGQTYMLSFFAATSNASGRTGDAIINVSVGNASQSISLVNRQTLAVWNTYNIGFTATDASATLLFENVQDANTHFAFIDGAAVTTATASAAPEPGSLALLALPFIGAIIARRRKAHSGVC